MSIDIQVAVIGLAGAVVGGLISSVIPWCKEKSDRSREEERKGRYSAIRIVAVLDEYAERCAEVVSDDGTCEGRPAGRTEQGEEYCMAQIATPAYPSFPADVDWQAVGAKSGDLMYRILSLSNTVRETDRYIASSSDHSSPPGYEEYFSARQEGYAYLGTQAISLAKGLRNEFTLPTMPKKPWDWGWDIEDFFQGKLKEAAQRNQVSEISLP